MIGAFATVLIALDVYLAVSDNSITFSQLFRNNEGKMAWFVFLMGGMVSKIYFRRSTPKRPQAIRLLLFYLALVIVLFIIGRSMDFDLSNAMAAVLFSAGGLLAYFMWIQYEPDRIAN